MTTIVGSAPGDHTRTIPLSHPRSTVVWPRHDRLELELPNATCALLEREGQGGLANLVSAVCCVFHRYHNEVVSLGVLDQSLVVRVLRLAVDPRESAPDVANIIARALDDGEFEAASIIEPTTAVNPQFAALLGFDVPLDEFPQLRQDINISLDGSANQLACSYNSKIFDKRSVASFLQHVHAFLVHALSIDRMPLGALSYLTDSEVRTLEAFSAPDVVGRAPRETLQDLFQRVAAAHPHRVAVETETTYATYAELDEMTSRVRPACGTAD